MKKIILVCLIACIIFSLVACGAESAQKKAIENYWEMVIDCDEKAVKKCLPGGFLKELEDEYGEDEVDEVLESVTDNMYREGDSYERQLGKKIKISIEITSSKEVDENTYERVIKTLEFVEIESNDIEEAVEVKYKCTLEGSDDEAINRYENIMIKINGKWYRYNFIASFAKINKDYNSMYW